MRENIESKVKKTKKIKKILWSFRYSIRNKRKKKNMEFVKKIKGKITERKLFSFSERPNEKGNYKN